MLRTRRSRQRDVNINEVRAAVLELINEHPKRIFYSRQLEVRLEKRFFHWMTNRAVRELVDERVLLTEATEVAPGLRVNFLRLPKNRYYKTEQKRVASIIAQYSDPKVNRAIGEQADMLFLNALAARQFVCHGQDVNEFRGRKWEDTEHNLDFIIERDGLVYGAEVKNTWGYIEKEELDVKLDMCDHLGVRPLMIVRYAPKTYIDEIIKRGGFALLFVARVHPFGHEALVNDINEHLEMEADCPKAIPDGIIDRFMKKHLKWAGV